MIEVAALLLCKLGGQSGSTEEIKAVLAAAGLEPNEDNLSKLMGDLEGKDINELLAAGQEKIKDIPFGGGGGGGGGAATGGGGDAGAPAAAAVVEEEEEVEANMGGDMFGGEAKSGDY